MTKSTGSPDIFDARLHLFDFDRLARLAISKMQSPSGVLLNTNKCFSMLTTLYMRYETSLSC